VKRIAPLPCSKEIYPVGFEIDKESKLKKPKSACEYLIEKMKYEYPKSILFYEKGNGISPHILAMERNMGCISYIL
jgi:hypothetical protein